MDNFLLLSVKCPPSQDSATNNSPDGEFSRPRLAVFAFASQNKNIAPAFNSLQEQYIFWIYFRFQLKALSKGLEMLHIFAFQPNAGKAVCLLCAAISCPPSRIRTYDHQLKRLLLYRLSYGRVIFNCYLARQLFADVI